MRRGQNGHRGGGRGGRGFYDREVRTLSPNRYRTIALLALISLAAIIVTGSLVRLTGSGLGCSDWPTCEQDQLLAPFEFHPMVEFVNRLITGLVSLAVIVAVLGSMRRNPRRRDLTTWSWVLVAGVLAQIVLGALVTKTELEPRVVLGHFLLSMVLLWAAVVLYHRAGQPDEPAPPASDPTDPIDPAVWGRKLWWARAMTLATAAVIVVGTLVTASGPHTGSLEAGGHGDFEPVERLPFDPREITRIHSLFVYLLLAVVIGTAIHVARHGTPGDVRRIRGILLTVVTQGAVGYLQYFTGLPIAVVAFHIFGVVVVWVQVVWFHLYCADAHRVDAPRAKMLVPS